MSKRLEILEASLAKKKAAFDARLQDHFDTVASSNGQPLNDKRNGQATLNAWDRQSESLRTLDNGIEKTTAAIEREKQKIAYVEVVSETLPAMLLEKVATGELVQWRKHPHTFFVPGVEKARIVWLEDKKQVAHKFVSSINDPEQRKVFARTYNDLYKGLMGVSG